MRYNQISNTLFITNRSNFCSKMIVNTIAILTSNDVKHNNADDVMGFSQNNDLFYLSGIDQEESILVVYPGAYKKENREILFIKETNAHIKIWDGEKLTKAQASEISGVKRVEWIKDFEITLQYMAFEADGFYLGHNEYLKRATKDQQTRQDRMISWCKEKYPLHQYLRAAKITRELRQIKSDEEIGLVKKAANISIESFKRVLKVCKPNIKEYELEAELTYNLIKAGAKRHAFQPIVASGKNACALHYNTNDDICNDGDMILMDFGAEYANYASDLTRCFPVNGKFTDRQKAVYNAVLNVKKESEKLLVPGTFLADYHKEVGKLMESELLGLGLIDQTDIKNQDPNWPAYKKYFMHGTSHFIGLDTHDVGLWSEPLRAGMVFTCEPGIYIPEENLGIRIENDVMIGEAGNVDMFANFPTTVEEIEAAMTE